MAKTGNTVRISRVLKAPPERVYKAFLDPNAMVKWMAPHGFTCKVHSIDAQVGGSYRMSFINFGNGQEHSFGGTYVELTPPRRIRYTDRFERADLPGEMAVTIEFKKVLPGTKLSIVQEGLPTEIPIALAVLGWQESLELLRLLVEPDIPGESEAER